MLSSPTRSAELSKVIQTPGCNSMGLCFHSWTKISCMKEDGLMTSMSTVPSTYLRNSSPTLMDGEKRYVYTQEAREDKAGCADNLHPRHPSHWTVASTLGSTTCDIQTFYSFYSSIDKETQNKILNLLESKSQPKICPKSASKV